MYRRVSMTETGSRLERVGRIDHGVCTGFDKGAYDTETSVFRVDQPRGKTQHHRAPH